VQDQKEESGRYHEKRDDLEYQAIVAASVAHRRFFGIEIA
jgi:hypothetical protein